MGLFGHVVGAFVVQIVKTVPAGSTIVLLS